MFDYAKKIKENHDRKFLIKDELAKILNVSFLSTFRCEWEKFETNIKTKKKLIDLFNEIDMKLDD